ncbi:SO_0444 family Cu/Zn efflux transporter [Nitratifractor sp.]
MQIIILSYLNQFWILLSSIAPYILLGIFLAGAMKIWIREEWIERELGGSSLISNLKAILFGIPLPLCSCSVIPFAAALRKSGASRSSTLSFLIATPITGIDSIVATYGVLGWFFTLYRIISSIFISLLAGILSLIFDRERQAEKEAESPGFVALPTERGAVAPSVVSGFAAAPRKEEPLRAPASSCCPSDNCGGEDRERLWIEKLWNHAVYEIFADFAKALLIGVALGALLTTFMPTEAGTFLGENLWVNYLLVIAIAAPLYICATSSIPLGVALLTAGVSPGAVFVFLTAGPASSTVTMSVIRKILGTRSLLIYLAAVLSGTLLFGAAFDLFFTEQAEAVRRMVAVPESPGFVAQVSAVVLLMLSWKVLRPKKSGGCCGG